MRTTADDGSRRSDRLAALHAAEFDGMVRLAVLMVDSRAIAEDVVHDAFAQVAERIDGLERPGGYLRQCVINGCRTHLRRRRMIDRTTPKLLEAPTVEEPELVDLHRALRRLPARQRAVVVLRYVDDADDASIAETLGCRPATVRSLAHRALTRLREELS